MGYVDRYWDKTLVELPFSPKPPEPEVVIQEVVREPEPPSANLEEKLPRLEQEISRLERQIELLTLQLIRQTEETKTAALYLGRKVPPETDAQ